MSLHERDSQGFNPPLTPSVVNAHDFTAQLGIAQFSPRLTVLDQAFKPSGPP